MILDSLKVRCIRYFESNKITGRPQIEIPFDKNVSGLEAQTEIANIFSSYLSEKEGETKFFPDENVRSYTNRTYHIVPQHLLNKHPLARTIRSFYNVELREEKRENVVILEISDTIDGKYGDFFEQFPVSLKEKYDSLKNSNSIN